MTREEKLEQLKTLDIDEMLSKMAIGDEDSILEYAETILEYSDIIYNSELQDLIITYALELLEPLAQEGNEEAKSLIDEYEFDDEND